MSKCHGSGTLGSDADNGEMDAVSEKKESNKGRQVDRVTQFCSIFLPAMAPAPRQLSNPFYVPGISAVQFVRKIRNQIGFTVSFTVLLASTRLTFTLPGHPSPP